MNVNATQPQKVNVNVTNNDAWDEAETEAKKGSGNWLKLEDGDTAVVAFLGPPKHYTAKPFNEGDTPPTKILINVFEVSDDGTGTLRVFDMAAKTYAILKEIRDKGKWPLANHLFEIARHGTSNQTRYTITPEPDPLTPERKAKLAALPLRDLGELADKIAFRDRDGHERERPQRRQDRAPAQSYSRPAEQQAPGPIEDESLPF